MKTIKINDYNDDGKLIINESVHVIKTNSQELLSGVPPRTTPSPTTTPEPTTTTSPTPLTANLVNTNPGIYTLNIDAGDIAEYYQITLNFRVRNSCETFSKVINVTVTPPD